MEDDLFTWADRRSAGDRLRDDGILLVSEHAGDWMVMARGLLDAWLPGMTGRTITADEIRDTVEPVIGPPHHPNAWGALTRPLLTAKRLRATGCLVKSRRTSNHSHANPEYEVMG